MTTLLIVDDNREMRQLVRKIADKVSDRIFECEDGDEALAAFEKHHPDWIVMDVEMKRLDGLQAEFGTDMSAMVVNRSRADAEFGGDVFTRFEFG